MAQPHVANSRTLTVDKNPAYPIAVADMKSDGQLSRRTCVRQCKYFNNIVEQDHRRIKRLVRPGLGFGSFHTARRTLAGFETMAMMRKGQLVRGQAVVIADLFDSRMSGQVGRARPPPPPVHREPISLQQNPPRRRSQRHRPRPRGPSI
jgi:hypothetical protein